MAAVLGDIFINGVEHLDEAAEAFFHGGQLPLFGARADQHRVSLRFDGLLERR